MILDQKEKLDWDDISIVPSTLSSISSRTQIDPFVNGAADARIPIFASPMDTVIDSTNAETFKKMGIEVCLPRHIKWGDSGLDDTYFYSYGLDEIINIVENGDSLPPRVLIDIANGHMTKLFEISKKIKQNYNVELMIGNIANPDTYRKYCEIGVDWVRVGIGGGCFTPGSLVTMSNGETKKIEEIQQGDVVITHKNRARVVLQKHIFDKNEKLLRINGIECTKNHEFYVILKSDRDMVNNENINDYAFWVEAADLRKEDHLLIKI
jgi:hypothetical protein